MYIGTERCDLAYCTHHKKTYLRMEWRTNSKFTPGVYYEPSNRLMDKLFFLLPCIATNKIQIHEKHW